MDETLRMEIPDLKNANLQIKTNYSFYVTIADGNMLGGMISNKKFRKLNSAQLK